MKKVKIKDIAARIGLSSTLVSLVLNGKADNYGIKRETQEKVIETATKMGFFKREAETVNILTEEDRTGLVGLIAPGIDDPLTSDIVPYLTKALASIGVGLVTIALDPTQPGYTKLISGMKKIFNGMIFAGDAADENAMRKLRNTSFPFMVLENDIKNLRISMVTTNCDSGASLMCSLISRKGYNNVTLLRSANAMPSAKNRVKCFKKIFNQNCIGSTLSDVKLPHMVMAPKYYLDDLAEYLRPPISTELLVVAEAKLLIPVLKTLEAGKFRIPADIAVVCLEDSNKFEGMEMQVTRLRRRLPELASKTAKIIWSEVKNSGKSKYKRTVSVPYDLLKGKSSG